MSRVHLSRLPGERALVSEGGTTHEVALADLPAFVAEREEDGPRWVWDDTARWCPPLLAAGVRVARCHDLRLSRRLLARAPAVDPALLAGVDAELWERLRPATVTEPALFDGHDAADHLRADVEDERQLAAIDASPDAARLRLLVAAESAGALAAAEMTHAGVPWSVDVHEALLAERLGPRPPRGARPRLLAECADDVRRLLGAPNLNPDSHPELLAALRRAGIEVVDTRASTLRTVDHPVVEPLLRYKSLAHLFSTNGWAWIDEWVRDGRFRPVYQPAGSATGRWASNGGGALSFPVQVRSAAVADEGWVLVVADVAQLEPRVLAGMSGDRALARAARGADLYQGMVEAGAVATRQHAKLGLLGAMYGATSGESGRMVAELTRRYPQAFGLVEEAARAGERGQVVRTLLGRGSPSLAGSWDESPEAPPTDLAVLDRRRRSFGRFTRNFVVQGTGAEWALCWIADLRNRLWRLGGNANSADEARAILNEGVFGDEATPVVVKADGLAAGKGVVVAANRQEALDAIDELASIAGQAAAEKIVLEECLVGREISLIMFADGEDFALMPPTRDHKRIGEGDTGPNTGGMGTFTDSSLLTEAQTKAIIDTIIKPTLKGCIDEGFPFRGILFLGLIMTASGSKLLEYNVRFGDPETQSILVRLETDLVEICEAMLDGRLGEIEIKWKRGSSATVVLAAEGYPQNPRKGDVISGLNNIADVTVFHAGTAKNDAGEFVTAGGRVLGVTATGENLDDALSACYRELSKISFEGMQYRRDIGR